MTDQITHDELVSIGRKWLIKPHAALDGENGHCSCPIVVSELVTAQWEIPDVLGFHDRGSILIECKTSRADFRKDAEKPFRYDDTLGVGKQRWFLAPKGIIKPEELPEKWGLLEVDEKKKIKITKNSGTFEYNQLGEIRILLSLMRRLNIQPDGHVAIKKYEILSARNKATFYIEPIGEASV